MVPITGFHGTFLPTITGSQKHRIFLTSETQEWKLILTFFKCYPILYVTKIIHQFIIIITSHLKIHLSTCWRKCSVVLRCQGHAKWCWYNVEQKTALKERLLFSIYIWLHLAVKLSNKLKTTLYILDESSFILTMFRSVLFYTVYWLMV